MEQPSRVGGADVSRVSMPTRPPAIPTCGELGLVVAARYEADLHMQTAEARRRFHTVGTLITLAALVLGYDFLSLIVGG
jgi:hypothetical protein